MGGPRVERRKLSFGEKMCRSGEEKEPRKKEGAEEQSSRDFWCGAFPGGELKRR